MSISRTATQTVIGANGVTLASTATITTDNDNDLSVSQAGSTTNTLYSVSYSGTNTQMFFATASQACTIKFNSSGSPALTITLAAGGSYLWYTGCGFSNPLPSSVTAYYVTVSGSTACQLDISCLVAA